MIDRRSPESMSSTQEDVKHHILRIKRILLTKPVTLAERDILQSQLAFFQECAERLSH